MVVLGAIFLGLACVCAVAVLYPYFVYPALLRVVPAAPAPRELVSPEDGSRFAVLFCAYNEEGSALEKTQNLKTLQLRYPMLEILIFDDGSTDRTNEIFSRLGPGVVQRGPGRAGKATGMRQLVQGTSRPLLLFTDANVMLDELIIEMAAKYFADATVGGVCGHLVYENAEQTATQAAGGAYWRLEEQIKELESRTGSVMGGDGSIFVMRRALYPNVPRTAQDDFTATMNVVLAGKRLIFADDVVARERLVARSKDEYRRKVRISARAVHTHMTMRHGLRAMRPLDRWKYSSHKLVRWGGAFFLTVGAMLGLVGAAMLDGAFAAGLAVVVGLGALSIMTVPRLAALKEILLALFATGQGVVLAMRGKTFATWTPPQSR